VAARRWPGVPVVHQLQVSTTDSRHLRQLGIASYGISTWPISRQDAVTGHGPHGPDERCPLRWWTEGVQFMRELTRELVR
jgi:acetylornithine deacetylase/succinyl-diaminopimelate desuccinylase-like protein